MIFLLFIMVIAAAILFFKCYNSLQRACQPVKETYANIQVMLRKKVELTQQLMDVCKGSSDSEKLLHFKISSDRMDSIKDIAAASSRADQAMAMMTQLSGQFPDLKTNVNYLQLSNKLEKLGDDLQTKRELYNAQVRQFNTIRGQVPTVFVARLLKSFNEAQMLEFGDESSLDRLQTFHTDDGQALENFLGGLGQKVAGGAKAAVGMAVDAGSAVAQKAKAGASAVSEFGHERFGTTRYRYSEGGVVKGPITRKELDALVLETKLPASSFVLEDGKKDWVKYEQLTAFEAPPPPDAAASAPPPPPDVRR